MEPSILSAGDNYLFNSKTVHGTQRTGEDNICLCVQFSPKLIVNDLEEQQFFYYFYLNSLSNSMQPKKPYAYFAAKMADMAITSMDGTGTSTMRTHSMLLSFAADLMDYVQYDIRRMPDSNEDNYELYEKILAYIENHLQSEQLSYGLCRELGMSEKSLYRYLKSSFGLTLKEMLDIFRVEKACEMLLDTERPLPVVWQTCGFSSEVSFYRNFKKQMGYTPNEYRKRRSTRRLDNTLEGSYLDFDIDEARRLLLNYAGMSD